MLCMDLELLWINISVAFRKTLPSCLLSCLHLSPYQNLSLSDSSFLCIYPGHIWWRIRCETLFGDGSGVETLIWMWLNVLQQQLCKTIRYQEQCRFIKTSNPNKTLATCCRDSVAVTTLMNLTSWLYVFVSTSGAVNYQGNGNSTFLGLGMPIAAYYPGCR